MSPKDNNKGILSLILIILFFMSILIAFFSFSKNVCHKAAWEFYRSVSSGREEVTSWQLLRYVDFQIPKR